MPRATGWAPALLPSRRGVTAHPTPSGSIPTLTPPRRSSAPSFGGVNGGSSDRDGWAVGGGVEARLWGDWTGKVEYLHADLGSFACGFVCTGVPGQITRIKLDEDIVRVGLNYHFMWPGIIR
jgi:opacity protein-like surface antigen